MRTFTIYNEDWISLEFGYRGLGSNPVSDLTDRSRHWKSGKNAAFPTFGSHVADSKGKSMSGCIIFPDIHPTFSIENP
jgi:hypothetical protein